MRRQTSLLVSLVVVIDRLRWPPEPAQRSRGRPKTYADRLIIKALINMLIRRLYTADALLTFLDQNNSVAPPLRPLLHEHGRFPSRRTWERRLAQPTHSLAGLIGYAGRHLVALLNPWAAHGRAVVFDSTPLATGGGVWPKKHREQGVHPPQLH